jgi:hypothetical protein
MNDVYTRDPVKYSKMNSSIVDALKTFVEKINIKTFDKDKYKI